jgi:subtilisin-like proprotein convertase family protein
MKRKIKSIKTITAGILACSLSLHSYSNTITHQSTSQILESLYDTDFKVYDLSLSNKISSLEEYLEYWVQSQGHEFEQLRLYKVKESLIAKHYYYQQYVQDIAIENATIVLSVSSKDGSFLKSNSHVVKKGQLQGNKPVYKVDKKEALTIAWNNLRASAKLRSKPTVQKVWLPSKHGLIATYRVAISISKPLGDWVQYIDSQSGEVLKLEQKIIFENKVNHQNHYNPNHFTHLDITQTRSLDAALFEYREQERVQANRKRIAVGGTGTVFDPDPKTTLNNDDLEDGSPASQFNGSYFTYTFPDVTLENGVYHLRSPWVEINDFDSPSGAPATSTDGNWLFTRGQNGFDDANVFYHIDHNQRYMQSLGFIGETGIQYGMIRADANGASGADNSYYSSGSNWVSFGHGGVNDSEDVDVILHEYGHAINYDINNNWSGPDAGGMGEGFGDYWAGSYSISTLNGDSFFPNRVFTWDGHNEFWPGRILNDLSARYNPNRSYPAHATVDGVLSDQLWSTPLFQSLLQLVDMGYSRDDVDTIILEAQFGLGGGLTMRIMAESIVQTAAALFPGEPHAGVFYQHFVKHNILVGGLDVEMLTLTAGDDDIIEPGEVVKLTIPLSSNGAVATDVSAQISIPNPFEPIVTSSTYADIQSGQTVNNDTEFSFDVPSDVDCGTPIDVNFSYSANINDLVFSDEKDFSLVVGDVEAGSALQTTPLPIPDNGPEVSSTLSINQAAVVVNNLRVRVDVEHTYIGDLILGIESPTGTRVVLHSRSGSSQDNLQVTYPDDVAPAQSLALLDGELLSGQWTLFVQDNAGIDIGQVVEWEIFFEKAPMCE